MQRDRKASLARLVQPAQPVKQAQQVNQSSAQQARLVRKGWRLLDQLARKEPSVLLALLVSKVWQEVSVPQDRLALPEARVQSVTLAVQARLARRDWLGKPAQRVPLEAMASQVQQAAKEFKASLGKLAQQVRADR